MLERPAEFNRLLLDTVRGLDRKDGPLAR